MITTPKQGNRLLAGHPWCADNGVYTGRYPGDEAYLTWLRRLRPLAHNCLFAVAPDVVGDHLRTLTRSRNMLVKIRELGYPAAFVAQDGMQFSSWDPWDEIDCLFIGGGDEFKLSRDAAELVDVANSLGKWTHMGRVNSLRRYRYAAAIGCDSVDGTHLTFAPDQNLHEVLQWRQIVAAKSAQCRP
ncbi:hypothetical protein DQ384_38495 [Sphaerisporangium album]|uniref:Uncharacterized protein n=2 Tax=Sphaerisporangium album TaxID=509200 RepID=A0A367ENT1_9ACTN|nr:hypothetical protein DQ384_38495 [Sphaerisporangium album]